MCFYFLTENHPNPKGTEGWLWALKRRAAIPINDIELSPPDSMQSDHKQYQYNHSCLAVNRLEKKRSSSCVANLYFAWLHVPSHFNGVL